MCGRTRTATRPTARLVQSLSSRNCSSRARASKAVSAPTAGSERASGAAAADSSTGCFPRTLKIEDDHMMRRSENVSPGCFVPVVYSREALEGGEELRCRCMRWGLCCSWERQQTSPFKVFNARAEGVMLKPMFKKLMTSGRRCVVPIDGFYEFKTLDNKKKQPYYLYKSNAKSSSGGELPQLLLAGIYDTWKDPSEPGEPTEQYSFSILTMDACPSISWLHHRQPCIMDLDTARRWLDCRCDVDDLHSSMRKACRNPPLAWHRVTNEINKTSYQGSDCSTQIDKRKGAITRFFGSSAVKREATSKTTKKGAGTCMKTEKETITGLVGPSVSNEKAMKSSQASAMRTNMGSGMNSAKKQITGASTKGKSNRKRPRNAITSFFERAAPKKEKRSPTSGTPTAQNRVIHGQTDNDDLVIVIDY